ncbi:MAG: nuclear transport factor 2 family protein [Sphingomonadales bacterium]|nr:nuclear transport factor 2 family protein [Sphingomonadales bacterium]PIX65351.1 MAG: ketosteroid isomerase [Sphingomonadales bacterium CG_4_10_14_3_um_filter_58_15]NCO49942.1 nuclear transport factor 2 family protein [Sphingomonadales bacterium]NCP00400.1 nuclear transport factor 2 family protein [Sphingomonadales bacterium]NCP26780.1 nuclear transport factor 2 family protein [Sphingomonadales bacterium]
MPSLAEIASDYAALMAAGETLAAAEKYWASDIIVLEPANSESDGPAIAIGKPAALARLTRWLAANAMSEMLIDGPFITGDQFALFIDMEITRRVTGERKPFSEIATYTVCEGQIVEERFFYG